MEFLVSAGQSKDVILLLEGQNWWQLQPACLVTQITNCLSLTEGVRSVATAPDLLD